MTPSWLLRQHLPGKECDLPKNRFQSPQTALDHDLAEAAPDHTGHIDFQQVNSLAFSKLIVWCISAACPMLGVVDVTTERRDPGPPADSRSYAA